MLLHMFAKVDIAACIYMCTCMNNKNINFYHFSIHKKKKYILVEIIYEQHCVLCRYKLLTYRRYVNIQNLCKSQICTAQLVNADMKNITDIN
jgi:hypothetical protein